MKRILTPLAIIMTAVSCNNSNPFLAEWNTPYGIPDFDAVEEKHYVPAVEAGIAQQQAEIDAIIANPDADMNKGSGIVMCCTFGDQTDIEWWKKYNLPLKNIFTPNGRIDEKVPGYGGLKIKEARSKIIEDLQNGGYVTKIEDFAFSMCTSLESVNIPSSVTSIGDSAFGKCDNLSEINISENNNSFSSENGVLFNKDKYQRSTGPGQSNPSQYTCKTHVPKVKLKKSIVEYAKDNELQATRKYLSYNFTCTESLTSLTCQRQRK